MCELWQGVCVREREIVEEKEDVRALARCVCERER